MALLVPDVGEVEMLSRILNATAPNNVVMHLFTNDKTPAEGDTVADYTEEDDASYSSVTLTGGSWSVTTTAGTTTAEYAAQTFTFAASTTIYGYYVTDNGGTTLMWAERLGSAATYPAGGGTLDITPKITLD
jgi:hypothetical protein